jgi:hypothetical protein
MKGRDGCVLYLDFDGVLHHENVWYHPRIGPYLPATVEDKYKLFMHVELLEELLEPYPHVQIVLSTSWSKRYGPARAAKNLGHKLRHRVIGATYHTRMQEKEFLDKARGLQVVEDAMRRKPCAWLALDDDYENWPAEYLMQYIKTHPTEGISDPDVLAEVRTKFATYFRLLA